MGNVIKVGMADLKVAKAPDSLITLGLGSCIGLTLYDPTTKVGGMVHYMLPDSTQLKNNANIAKFGDTGIKELYRLMIANGASPKRMVAKIAGGAKMFEVSGLSNVGNVGERNALQAKKILKELNIPLVAEDTGLNYGRTVELFCENGDFYMSTGPEIFDITLEETIVTVKCSPARQITLTNHGRFARRVFAEGAETITKAEFDITDFFEKANTENSYILITVTDKDGNYASTRAYYLSELIEK